MIQSNPPAWVSEYIGIPFAEGGRDRRQGLDCYGLVRVVYAERLGVMLPRCEGDGAEIIRGQLEGDDACWVPVPAIAALALGDVAMFRVGRQTHIGLVVSRRKMLHCLAGTESCLEDLDSPVWLPRLLGVYRHQGPVRLVSRPFPFSPVADVSLPAGGSVASLLAQAGVRAVPGMRVFVGDREVPAANWGNVRPKPGRQVTVALAVRGGGGGGSKDVLRIVLSIAVLAAAVAIPGAAVFAGTAVATGTTGAAVLSAGVAIAGTLAINALIPPPKSRLSDQGGLGGSPSIQGSRNDIRPYAPIPVPFGTYRLVPPFAAIPHTEVVGNDQFVRMLYMIGIGPVRLSDFKIGETPLDDFEGVQLQVHRGYVNSRNLTLYPNTVHEEGLSVLLEQVGSWTTRTSQTGVEELAVDITFPTGLAQVSRAGDFSDLTVDVAVEYRPVSGGAWIKINGDAGTTGSPVDAGGLDFLTRTPEAEYGGGANHSGRIAWSGTGGLFPDTKPAYLPAAGFAWVAETYVFAATQGTYEFGIDGSDAMDLEVNGELVASWYGEHAPLGSAGVPNFTVHKGSIALTRGWHHLRFRVENRSAGGGAAAVGWKTPGAGSFAIVPSASIHQNGNGINPSLAGKWGVRWYRFNAYLSTISTTASKADQIRRSLSWSVPSGQYEVRLRRVTPDTNDTRILDKVYWTALRSIDHQDPVRIPGTARVALRIRATDQLNGVVDQFNCLCQSVLPTWDPAEGAWVEKATSNPAAIYRAILQGRGNHRPIPDAKLDLAALQEWSEFCDDEEFEFNGVIDFAGTVYERLVDVAAAGRATPGMRNGLYSVVRDRVQTVPVQHFTPRNTFGFSGRKAFATLPHAFRVLFMNAENGYQEDERIVLADGYQIDGLDAWGVAAPGLPPATIFEELQYFGCTSAEQAFKHGRYFHAVAALRPEVWSFQCDVEHMVCSRGDLVLVTHDVPLIGLAYGRVTARQVNGSGELEGLDLDELCPMEMSGSYRLRVRLDDGTAWTRDLITVPGSHHKVLFTVPVPAGTWPAVGDLFMFGPAGQETREMLVKSIDIDADLSARLEVVDHAPAVHDADVGAIPPFDSGVTRVPVVDDGPELPVVEAIRSDDWVMTRDTSGVLQPRIVLTLKRQSGTRPLAAYAQVRVRLKDAGGGAVGPWTQARTVPIDNNQVGIDGVIVGRTYQISVRHLTAGGRASAWVFTWVPVLAGPTVVIEHTVIGQTLAPPDPVSLEVIRLSDGTRQYSWDLGVQPPDIAGVHLRWGPTSAAGWGDLAPLHDDVLQASPAELNVPPAGTWKFGVKAVDLAGNESIGAVIITRTIGQPRLEGVAFSEDAAIAGWPGTKTACFRNGQNYIEANDSTTWATLPATWAGWSRWNLNPSSPIVYQHTALDAGFVFDFSPDVVVVTDGSALVEVRWSSDGISWSAWEDVQTAKQRTVSARHLEARVTVTATGGSPVPAVRSMLVLMRAETRALDLQDIDTAALPLERRLGVGDVRLPVPVGQLQVIRSVALTFNGQGAGWSWELVDKDPVAGPRVRMFNASRQPAHAIVDAVVRGL